MRKTPPRVVMMAAGGMCSDISPVSLTCTLGQQLSMQAIGSSDDSVSAKEGHKSQVVSSQVGASQVPSSVSSVSIGAAT
jgi:hypothetical protein